MQVRICWPVAEQEAGRRVYFNCMRRLCWQCPAGLQASQPAYFALEARAAHRFPCGRRAGAVPVGTAAVLVDGHRSSCAEGEHLRHIAGRAQSFSRRSCTAADRYLLLLVGCTDITAEPISATPLLVDAIGCCSVPAAKAGTYNAAPLQLASQGARPCAEVAKAKAQDGCSRNPWQ